MKKIILVPIILIFFFIAIFIIAGMPFFLHYIKGKIEFAIQNEIHVPIHITSLKGNLFYAIEVNGVNVDDVIVCEKLNISYNIFKLLSKEIDINSVVLDGLRGDLNRVEELVKKVKDLETTAFNVRIRQLSLVNSSFFGVLNDRTIEFSVAIHGVVLPTTIIIDTLILKTDTSNISVRGTIPLKHNGEFDVEYSLGLLLDDLVIDNLHGTLVSNGYIRGNTASLRIINNTEVMLTYQENEVSGVLQVDWQTPLFDNLKARCMLEAKTTPLREKNGEKNIWKLVADVNDNIVFCNLSCPYGNMRTTGFLKGDMNTPEFITELVGNIQHENFQSEVKGTITYEKDELTVKNFTLMSDEVFVACNGSLLTREPQIVKGDILIDCSDISFINNFLQNPQPLSGEMKFSTHIKGLLQNPFATATVVIEDVTIYNEEINHADFYLTFQNSILSIDASRVESPRGTVDIAGMFSLPDSTFEAHVGSNGITLQSPEVFGNDTIPVSGTVRFDVDLQGNIKDPQGEGRFTVENLVYDSLIFDNYEIMFTLADNIINMLFTDDKKSIDLEARAQLYELSPFSVVCNLNHFDLKNFLPADEAYITARIVANSETFELENIKGELQIETLYLATDGHVIQNVDTVNVKIDEGIADILACTFDVHNQRIDCYGQLPIDFTTGNMNLEVNISRIDISEVITLLPRAPQIQGIVFADISIMGTFQAPVFNGQLGIENVKLSLPEITVDSVFCMAKFRNSCITIDHFKGKINRGYFGINGFAEISQGNIDSMFIHLLVDTVDLKLKKFGSVDFSSRINASAQRDSIHISGEVTINEAVYDVPFRLRTIVKLLNETNRPPPKQHEILKRIYCDIGISTSNDVDIANNVADLEIGIDLQLKGLLSRLNVYGTITSADEGTIHYLGKKFNISHATVHFDNPYKIDPLIDLYASTSISLDDVDYEIFILLNGTAEKWDIELTSNPSLPEQNITNLLLKGTARGYAVDIVRSGIEEGAERYFGLDKVRITGESSDSTQTEISIEKSIGSRLTLIYSMGLESWELHQIGSKYDVNDNLSIFTLYDQLDLNTSVDLDFHFEFK